MRKSARGGGAVCGRIRDSKLIDQERQLLISIIGQSQKRKGEESRQMFWFAHSSNAVVVGLQYLPRGSCAPGVRGFGRGQWLLRHGDSRS